MTGQKDVMIEECRLLQSNAFEVGRGASATGSVTGLASPHNVTNLPAISSIFFFNFDMSHHIPHFGGLAIMLTTS